jgi:hypothetical protein
VGGFDPEVLDVVVKPGILVKHVNDEVGVVEDDPSGRLIALDVMQAEPGFQGLPQVVHDGLDMGLNLPMTYHDVMGVVA